MRNLTLVVLVLASAAACGKKSETGGAAAGGKVASCNSAATHSCREYRDANLALGSDSLAKLCTAVDTNAKFTGEPCPTAGLVSTCKFSEGKDFLYEGYPALDTVEQTCKTMNGTYTKSK